jgi:hypothetical protein
MFEHGLTVSDPVRRVHYPIGNGTDWPWQLQAGRPAARGVTYSMFESAPDAPFMVFETVLPGARCGGDRQFSGIGQIQRAQEQLGDADRNHRPETAPCSSGRRRIALQGCEIVKASKPRRRRKEALSRATVEAGLQGWRTAQAL